MLTLAGLGDTFEEMKDPLHLVSSAYENTYGFIPKKYKKSNFYQMMRRSLITGDIEMVVKNGKQYIRLTSKGKTNYRRDFSIAGLTKNWDKKWTILTFDIEEKHRRTRDRLRNKLKGIGFGMLQESVWITPLPIGDDIFELMDSLNLSDNTFIMKSELLVGDPKELARKVWRLDNIEEKCNELIEMIHDRDSKRSEEEKRVLRKRCLEMFVNLPPLPGELLPPCANNLKKYLF